MNKLRLPNTPDRVPLLAVAKSYGLPIRVKLGGCQENFKVTLLERPPEKSCSTSTFSREISLQIFSPTFLKRFPCKLSKPSKSSKLSKISRQQASQATQACQAHQASQAKQASLQARQANRIQTASQQLNREVTERVFVLPGHSASVAINLFAHYHFTTDYDPPCLAYWS